MQTNTYIKFKTTQAVIQKQRIVISTNIYNDLKREIYDTHQYS